MRFECTTSKVRYLVKILRKNQLCREIDSNFLTRRQYFFPCTRSSNKTGHGATTALHLKNLVLQKLSAGYVKFTHQINFGEYSNTANNSWRSLVAIVNPLKRVIEKPHFKFNKPLCSVCLVLRCWQLLDAVVLVSSRRNVTEERRKSTEQFRATGSEIALCGTLSLF